MKLIDDINQSIEIENKSSYADRVFNGLSLGSGGIAAALLLSSLIAYAVDTQAGLWAFAAVFYPLCVMLAVSYIFGIAELLRNRYFSSIMSVALTSVVLVVTVVYLILQGVYYGNVAIFPFFKP